MIMKPLVIFDFEGTLLDCAEGFVGVVNAEAVLRGYVGGLSVGALRERKAQSWLRLVGVSFFRTHGFLKRVVERDFLSSAALFDGVPGLLRELSRHAELALLTVGDVSSVNAFLRRHRLRGLFSSVVSASYFGKNKSLKRLLKQLDARKSGALYVGDEVLDVFAARRAGIPCLSVGYGFDSVHLLLRARPALLAASLDESRELLLAWAASRV